MLQSELDTTRPIDYSTNTEVWNQGAPQSPSKGQGVTQENVKGVASAIMARAGNGQELLVRGLSSQLRGTPYADFADWFTHAVDMEVAPLALSRLCFVMIQAPLTLTK